MKKTREILKKIQTLILSEDFKTTNRLTQHDFTRNCLVTFPVLVVLILNMMRRSLQAELNSFFRIACVSLISKQAFSAARIKLLPSVFINLNKALIQEYYCDNEFKTMLGFRLIGVDGSTLQLTDNHLVRKKYGICSNKKEGMPMSRISHAYDLLNGITLDAIMRPYSVPERTIAFDHILNILPASAAEDLYLFDRGYPSIILIFFLLYHRKHFVMRCSTGWLTLVNQVLNSGKKDAIIEIRPKMLGGKKIKEFKKLFPMISVNSFIKIRVLIIDLCTGEKEILVTSLLDTEVFDYGIFKDLYHQRWGSEENYKFHKVAIEIENFSGKTPHAIEQDFHATVLVGNISALLAAEAEMEEQEVFRGKYKYDYKINKNISISILKDELLKALFDPTTDLEVFCERMKSLMKKSIIPIRPGRRFAHVRKNNRKYHMNRRRAL